MSIFCFKTKVGQPARQSEIFHFGGESPHTSIKAVGGWGGLQPPVAVRSERQAVLSCAAVN